jgi:hypothetical protein
MTKQEHLKLWDMHRIAARDALDKLLTIDINDQTMWQEFKKNERLASKHFRIWKMMDTKELKLKRMEIKGA